jgi:hypothetical protein
MEAADKIRARKLLPMDGEHAAAAAVLLLLCSAILLLLSSCTSGAQY